MFTQGFGALAHDGDTITYTIGAFTVTARIVRDLDMSSTRPDKKDCAFWPQLDPEAPGYVPPEDFQAAYDRAEKIMAAWECDEWWYCGIVVTVISEGVKLGSASLWGIECNYPGSDNRYLLEVANELQDEAIDEACAKIHNLAVLHKTPGKRGRKPKPDALTPTQRSQRLRDKRNARIAQLEATVAAYRARYGELPAEPT